MSNKQEDCRVFVAPLVPLVPQLPWGLFLELLAEVVNAVREDGAAQILQRISTDPDGVDSKRQIFLAYSKFFGVFCFNKNLCVTDVSSVDDTYFVITIRLGTSQSLPQKA